MRLLLPQSVTGYLSSHHVMTLATQGSDGPWAAAVFYVEDGQTLVFLSSPGSRHGRHLAHDPRCAATIQDNVDDWSQIKGIQLEGRVSELHGDEQAQARQSYGERFTIVGRLANAPAAIVEALAQVRWYRLVPERLCFIDNSRGFGHRDEFAIGRD